MLPLDQQIRQLRARICTLEKTISGTDSILGLNVKFKRIQFTIGGQDAQDLIDAGYLVLSSRNITINQANTIQDSLSFTIGGTEVPQGAINDDFLAYTSIAYTTPHVIISFNSDIVAGNRFIIYLSYIL